MVGSGTWRKSRATRDAGLRGAPSSPVARSSRCSSHPAVREKSHLPPERTRLRTQAVSTGPSSAQGSSGRSPERDNRKVSEIPALNVEGAVPSRLPVLPLKSTVVFPRIFIPLSVGRKKSLQLLEDLTGVERHIAVATQLEETAEDVGFKDLHHVGTMVRVQHLLKLPDGTVQLAVLGLRRIRLTKAISEDPYLTCAVEMDSEITEDIQSIEREALMRRAITSFQQLVSLAPHRCPSRTPSRTTSVSPPSSARRSSCWTPRRRSSKSCSATWRTSSRCWSSAARSSRRPRSRWARR